MKILYAYSYLLLHDRPCPIVRTTLAFNKDLYNNNENIPMIEHNHYVLLSCGKQLELIEYKKS